MKLIYLLPVILLFCAGCVDDPEFGEDVRNAKIPTVITSDNIVTAATSVTVSGGVSGENGAPVTEAGFCWSKEPNATINDSKASLGNRKATFSNVVITGFEENTKYYIRAYATNAKGTGYGAELSFTTTSGIGTVKTYSVTDLHATTAVCAGKILNRGEGDLSGYGFYLSQQPNPTAEDSVFTCSQLAADSTFAVKITKLTPKTTYYVRAFAYNSHGYFNGSSVDTFRTTDGLPVLDKFERLNVSYQTATFSVAVTNEGDASVSKVGFCYSSTTYPTISNDTVIAGKGMGTFEGVIRNLKSQHQYYVRAFAINSFGVTYSEGEGMSLITLSNLPTVTTQEVSAIRNGSAVVGGELLDKGMTAVTDYGVCYSTVSANANITAGNVVRMSSETTAFTDTIKGLKGATTYYVRAFATNSAGTSYGNVVSFTTPAIFVSKASFSGGSLLEGSSSYFSIGEHGYLLGGDTGSSYTSNFWSYNATDNSWQQLASQPKKLGWQAVSSTTVAGIVFGGLGEDNEALSDFIYYSAVDNNWHNINVKEGVKPDAKYRVASVTSATNISYFIGGRSDNSIVDEVWSFPLQEETWIQHAAFPISQCGGIAVEINGRLYVGLGQTSISAISSSYTNQLWSTDANAETWTEETDFPGDYVKCGISQNQMLYVVDNDSYIWQYNPETKVWKRKSQLSIRVVHCVFELEGVIYFGLGSSTNSLIAYYPEWDN